MHFAHFNILIQIKLIGLCLSRPFYQMQQIANL